MKKIILSTIFFGLTFISFAQQKNNKVVPNNIIKMGFSTYFVGDQFVLGINWEHKIANRTSLQLELYPILNRGFLAYNRGLALAVGYRKYISKNEKGIQGLYYSPTIKAGLLKQKYTFDRPTTITNINGAFLFGKQWVYASRFVLDLNGGISLFNNYSDPPIIYGDSYFYTPYNRTSLAPNINLKIGYTF